MRGQERDRTVLRLAPAIQHDCRLVNKAELQGKHPKTVQALRWCGRCPSSRWQVHMPGTPGADEAAGAKGTFFLGSQEDVIHFLRSVRRLANKRGLDGRFFERSAVQQGPDGPTVHKRARPRHCVGACLFAITCHCLICCCCRVPARPSLVAQLPRDANEAACPHASLGLRRVSGACPALLADAFRPLAHICNFASQPVHIPG